MPERLTDERLAELQRLCARLAECRPGVFPAGFLPAARTALPALIAEVRALRLVAEAAEAALELLRDPRTRRIDAIAHLERYVADWRQVRGGS